MEKNCNDCKFYLPVDVFKGICKQDKNKITPESIACQKYEANAKCKFCTHFSPEKENIGKCQGKNLAYPEMIAITCKAFEWYKKN
jgi:4-hydroxyphenylacetate decarboxylase small subunit